MGTDRRSQYTQMSGILLPHPTFAARGVDAIDRAYSTLTEAGPRPGIAEAQSQTDLVLESGGTQAASRALRLRTIRSGMPGLDQAGLAWRYGTIPDPLWRGCDVPTMLSEWECARVNDVTTTGPQPIDDIDALALVDGTILAAVGTHEIVPTVVDRVQVERRDPTTRAWTTYTVIQYGYQFSVGRSPEPCLLQLPSGRVLCFYWVEIQAGALVGRIQLQMSYSDTSGTTWSVGATACLPVALIYAAAGAGVSEWARRTRELREKEGWPRSGVAPRPSSSGGPRTARAPPSWAYSSTSSPFRAIGPGGRPDGRRVARARELVK